MINETKLWTLLDQLQHWTGYVDYNDNSNYNDLCGAITAVMADLDTDDSNTGVKGTMPMSGYWRPWGGGKQPVPDGTHVEVQFRCGDTHDREDADGWYWEHNGNQYDIVAYRVIGYKPEETKPIIPDGVHRPMAYSKPTDLRPLPDSEDLTQKALHNCVRQNARLYDVLSDVVVSYYTGSQDDLEDRMDRAASLLDEQSPEPPEWRM